MEDSQMAGIFFMFFGALFVVFAGLSAISPSFLKEVVFWRAGSIFDDAHPKEQAKIWAKAMLMMALGPFIGGGLLYLLGGMGKGGIGAVALIVSSIFFFIKGGKYAGRETKRLMGEEDEPLPEPEIVCSFCGASFKVSEKKCPQCGAPASYSGTAG